MMPERSCTAVDLTPLLYSCNVVNRKVNFIITGVLFSIFWSSASVAGKFGLLSAEPLLLFNIRFLTAGVILLAYALVIEKSRMPKGREWRALTVFGTFNTTLYLGIFVIALQHVSPGITTLALALNPLFISMLSALWMKRKVAIAEWFAIVVGIVGVLVATYPLILRSEVQPVGLGLLGFSMLAYSFGAVYYAGVSWELSRTSVNAWQVFIGGILLIPFTFALHERENVFNLNFFASLLWLVAPVSILAVQLWLRLLKSDAVKASLWLYLCPVFGFIYARIFFHETITWLTFAGAALVMGALYIGQRKN